MTYASTYHGATLRLLQELSPAICQNIWSCSRRGLAEERRFAAMMALQESRDPPAEGC